MKTLALAVPSNVAIAAALAAFRPVGYTYFEGLVMITVALISATLIASAIAWALVRATRMPRVVGYLVAGIVVGATMVGAGSYFLADTEDVSAKTVIALAVRVVPISAGLGLVLWLCERMASNNALERERGR
jgi:predicted Kef-type K+ transport protein